MISDLDSIQRQIDHLSEQAFSAEEALSRECATFKKTQQYGIEVGIVWRKAQALAQTIQQQAHSQIAEIVSSCLHSVFSDDTYDFEIRFDRKRGKTEASLILIKNGNVVEDPINEDSGGVINIAAFALRLACLLASKPQPRKFLVLDEPFHHVSEKYRLAVRDLIHQLARDFHCQFLIVTHDKHLMQGTIIHL